MVSMHRIIPPICLLLALTMVVLGFGVWALAPPEANVALHRARAAGDDQHREVFEADLRHQQLKRKLLVGCLFAAGAALVATAFLSMRPAENA